EPHGLVVAHILIICACSHLVEHESVQEAGTLHRNAAHTVFRIAWSSLDHPVSMAPMTLLMLLQDSTPTLPTTVCFDVSHVTEFSGAVDGKRTEPIRVRFRNSSKRRKLTMTPRSSPANHRRHAWRERWQSYVVVEGFGRSHVYSSSYNATVVPWSIEVQREQNRRPILSVSRKSDHCLNR
ncbi:hypothetical protein C8T65DRAFT_673763, partial [Cerioporus squamosus]